MSAFHVPVVDVSPYVSGGGEQERAAVAAAVDAACRDVGFIQILGHGVPDEAVEALADAVDALFGLPLSTKSQWIRPAHENRGYTPPKSESLALSAGVQSEARMKDFFEAFNVGTSTADHPDADLLAEHYAANTWPSVPGFQEAVDAWRAHAGRVARTMIEIFEDALGLGRGSIGRLATHPIEVLRLNNYALPAGTDLLVEDDLIGMGAHTDYGIVTILWADQVKGLQVLADGRWHDVSPADGALLINLGDLTTRLTNEQWLSTLHRVKPPIVDGTILRRRSAAYFFDGDAEAVVGPLPGFLGEASPARYSAVTVDEHIRAKLSGSRAGVLNSSAAREAERVHAARG
ncbi:2-oxoglutarate and iron-dependent oxygenase domain-containing protein [Nocardioides sp. BP30]|uniref:isopenicillin N synthase family dioxygenase n=1 Tax=Nocardioides sp. BP30 TaxID=3036374 RepID=UPI002468E796|nr:2-oxoglutarate and iron-dependent oxygenase domain-containing protein [Nocardioides sp. BP30]WGL50560.1 2-oxoglutarate and iron-dependent oxygenase domain-containing protein [Nocardioides sp. BP30]